MYCCFAWSRSLLLSPSYFSLCHFLRFSAQIQLLYYFLYSTSKHFRSEQLNWLSQKGTACALYNCTTLQSRLSWEFAENDLKFAKNRSIEIINTVWTCMKIDSIQGLQSFSKHFNLDELESFVCQKTWKQKKKSKPKVNAPTKCFSTFLCLLLMQEPSERNLASKTEVIAHFYSNFQRNVNCWLKHAVVGVFASLNQQSAETLTRLIRFHFQMKAFKMRLFNRSAASESLLRLCNHFALDRSTNPKS